MIIKAILLELMPFVVMILTGGLTVRVTSKRVGKHRAQVALRERAYADDQDSRKFLKPEDLEYLATWDHILGINTDKEPEPKPSAADIVPVVLPTPTQGPKAAIASVQERAAIRKQVLADVMDHRKAQVENLRETLERAQFGNVDMSVAHVDIPAVERFGRSTESAGEQHSLAVRRFQQGWNDECRAAEAAEQASTASLELTVDAIDAELQRLDDIMQRAKHYSHLTGVLVNLLDPDTGDQIAVDLADATQDEFGKWHVNNISNRTPRSKP